MKDHSSGIPGCGLGHRTESQPRPPCSSPHFPPFCWWRVSCDVTGGKAESSSDSSPEPGDCTRPTWGHVCATSCDTPKPSFLANRLPTRKRNRVSVLAPEALRTSAGRGAEGDSRASAFRALVPGQPQGTWHSLGNAYPHAPTAVQYSVNSTFIRVFKPLVAA